MVTEDQAMATAMAATVTETDLNGILGLHKAKGDTC